jgi:hypothetical protein
LAVVSSLPTPMPIKPAAAASHLAHSHLAHSHLATSHLASVSRLRPYFS